MRRTAIRVHYGGVEPVRDDALLPLLKRFRCSGDPAAMEELVSRTRRKLDRAAGRIGARQDAEDSVQAAYHALLVRPRLPDAPILPWLMAAVIRIAYRRKATARREIRIAEHLARPRPDGTPVDRIARTEENALLRREVDGLPAMYRDPLVLFYLEGLSSAETARLLEIPQSTVTTRLQRGRRLLRSRLGPALAGGLMFMPWLLVDGGRMLGGAVAAPGPIGSIGGVMQAKTGVLMAGIGLVAGSIGLLVGSSTLSANDVTSGRRADASARYREAELMNNLAERDAEVAELRQRLERQETEGTSGARPRTTTAVRSAAKPWALEEILGPGEQPFDQARAGKAAERLGVSNEDLQIAIKAYHAIKNDADPEVQSRALAALAGLGEARARAAAAMLRGVERGKAGGRAIRTIMETSTVEGQEQVFIDLLKDDVSSSWTKQSVLRNLDVSESPIVGDYLVKRLESEQNRYFAATIVMTLGRMKETRAVPVIRTALAKGGDWAAFDIYSLVALGSIGGRESTAVLLEYLRARKLRHVDYAIRALAATDENLARGEAGAILNRPDAAQLPAATLEILRQHAGRSK